MHRQTRPSRRTDSCALTKGNHFESRAGTIHWIESRPLPAPRHTMRPGRAPIQLPGQRASYSLAPLSLTKLTPRSGDRVTPRDCPRFERCSAPVCPLVPCWSRLTHCRDEPVCLYLREAVKPDAKARLEGVISDKMVAGIMQALPGISARYDRIRKALSQSRKTGSSIDRIKRNATRGDVNG